MDAHRPSSCQDAEACKLCHGPLTTTLATAALASSAAIKATASRQGIKPPTQIACHANCVLFACPGCISKDKSSYQILNLKNHIYDYHCSECMEEVAPSRRGSLDSDYGSVESPAAMI